MWTDLYTVQKLSLAGVNVWVCVAYSLSCCQSGDWWHANRLSDVLESINFPPTTDRPAWPADTLGLPTHHANYSLSRKVIYQADNNGGMIVPSPDCCTNLVVMAVLTRPDKCVPRCLWSPASRSWFAACFPELCTWSLTYNDQAALIPPPPNGTHLAEMINWHVAVN